MTERKNTAELKPAAPAPTTKLRCEGRLTRIAKALASGATVTDIAKAEGIGRTLASRTANSPECRQLIADFKRRDDVVPVERIGGRSGEPGYRLESGYSAILNDLQKVIRGAYAKSRPATIWHNLVETLRIDEENSGDLHPAWQWRTKRMTPH